MLGLLIFLHLLRVTREFDRYPYVGCSSNELGMSSCSITGFGTGTTDLLVPVVKHSV